MTITPIDELDDRFPQAGRIRTGEQVKGRNDKMRPQKLNHFRFTSGDRDLIDWCAQTYGGDTKPFNAPGSGDKWMVDTPLSQLNVLVAGFTLAYEKWDPHLERRCNGRTCEVLVQTPDDAGYRKVDCICAAKGLDDETRECSKILRLPVMLDAEDAPTLGTWRLDTRSENSIKEIRGFFRLLEHAGQGPHRATMQLIERRQPTPRGQPNREFNVITLDYKGGFESLLAGGSRLVQLPTLSATPAAGVLGAGSPTVTPTQAGEPAGNDGVGEGQLPPAASSPAPSTTAHEGSAVMIGTPTASYALTDDDIVDAEVVDDVPLETIEARRDALVAKYGKKATVLLEARQIAPVFGQPMPTTFETISDVLIQDLLRDTEAGNDEHSRATTDS